MAINTVFVELADFAQMAVFSYGQFIVVLVNINVDIVKVIFQLLVVFMRMSTSVKEKLKIFLLNKYIL